MASACNYMASDHNYMASAQVRRPTWYLRSHRSLLHAGGHSAHYDLVGTLELAVGWLQIPFLC